MRAAVVGKKARVRTRAAPAKTTVPAAVRAQMTHGEKILRIVADFLTAEGIIKSAEINFLTTDKTWATTDPKIFSIDLKLLSPEKLV